MSNNAQEIERDEIEMLLPWYATGRLTLADKQKVERYAAMHPHMALHIDVVKAEREQTVITNEALALPSAGALDRLMAAVAGERHTLRQGARSGAPPHRLSSFFHT